MQLELNQKIIICMSYVQNINCGLKAKYDIVSICISIINWRTRAVFSKYYETSAMIGYITLTSNANIFPKMEENIERYERENVLPDLEKNRIPSLLSLSPFLFLSLAKIPTQV